MVGAIDRLSHNAAFVEAAGQEHVLSLPGGSLRHYVAAEPAGTWALNLALAARPLRGLPAAAAIVPRAAFRLDLDVEERAAALLVQWASATGHEIKELRRLEGCLRRGREALAGLSRNARAGDAWALVAALGPTTRIQVARTLGLSRAGSDLPARALAAAGLVTLEPGGRIIPTDRHDTSVLPQPLVDGPLGAAMMAIDDDMTKIDRLLARGPI